MAWEHGSPSVTLEALTVYEQVGPFLAMQFPNDEVDVGPGTHWHEPDLPVHTGMLEGEEGHHMQDVAEAHSDSVVATVGQMVLRSWSVVHSTAKAVARRAKRAMIFMLRIPETDYEININS